jgi:hypothetical protein
LPDLLFNGPKKTRSCCFSLTTNPAGLVAEFCHFLLNNFF